VIHVIVAVIVRKALRPAQLTAQARALRR
jgi:hypothetical protein